MPLARYFLYVGGVLLALLLISNVVLPNLPVVDETDASLPVIRIHSDRKWPERVVFDTNVPTITPAPTTKVEAGVPPPSATVADVSAKARLHEAFAQADVKQVETAGVKKPAPKLQPKRKIAKKRYAPPVMLVAQQPRFGWFDNGGWSSTW